MKMPNWQLIALILAVLAILPIWLIDVAPLADWPFHLAISNEIHLLSEGQTTSSFYSLNYSFLGYSLTHSAITFLQNFTDILTAGKIFLSILSLLSIFCWNYALTLVDEKKKNYYLLGLIANQSAFFYLGMVSFLLAVHIGILFFAIAFSDKFRGPTKYILTAILATLTFFSHAYVFFLLASVLLLYYAYEVLSKKSRTHARQFLFLSAFFALFLLNTITNSSITRDTTYFTSVLACNSQTSAVYDGNLFDISNSFPLGLISQINSAIFRIFPIGYLLPILSNSIMHIAIILSVLALVILTLKKFKNFQKIEESISKTITQIKLNKVFLALFLIFYLHYLILPFNVGPIYFINERSIPFMLLFLFLAIENKTFHIYAQKILVVIVVISLLSQAFSFVSHSQEQKQIMKDIEKFTKEIPNNSTVFILPAVWNSRVFTFNSPVQENPQYHAMMLIQNPTLYISNMFNFQDTFILRSNFKTFDDIRIWYSHDEKLDELITAKCYFPIPKEYDYFIVKNMTVQKNYGQIPQIPNYTKNSTLDSTILNKHYN